jgi:hypothetical protein
MSRIHRAVAQRIDRLAGHAHRFHRYAHHPLCVEYREELVSLGRRARVCRGCASAFVGVLAGASAGLVFSLPSPSAVLGLWTLAIAGGGAKTLLRSRRGRARWPKTVSRFLPACSVAYAVVSALRAGPWGLVLAVATAGVAVLLTKAYRRRGPDRTPCTTCPERYQEKPCRGVLPVVRRERAFRRLAGRWIARAEAPSSARHRRFIDSSGPEK